MIPVEFGVTGPKFKVTGAQYVYLYAYFCGLQVDIKQSHMSYSLQTLRGGRTYGVHEPY